MARPFTEWLLQNRRVSFSRDSARMSYTVSVLRKGGQIVRREICEEQLVASRIPVIELVQTMFDNPIDRIAVGLAFRKRWHEDTTARSMVAGQALHHDRAYTPINCRCVPAPVATPTGRPEDQAAIRRVLLNSGRLQRSARAWREATEAAEMARGSMTSLSESMRRHRTRADRINAACAEIEDQLGSSGQGLEGDVPEGTKFTVMAPRNPALPIYRPR